MPRDGIAVELRGLAMRFGAVEALRGLDARIPAGRITGLVGPDGAGKTTLLRLLAGLMEPAAGQALLFGRPAREVAADAPNSIGYMPQRFGLYEDFPSWPTCACTPVCAVWRARPVTPCSTGCWPSLRWGRSPAVWPDVFPAA